MDSFYNGEIAVAVALVVIVIYWMQNDPRSGRLPPGPRPLPLIGNAHQMPYEYAEQVFALWRHTYGDMIFVRIFNTPALVINSAVVAHDLLVKRGTKYADRAHSTLFIDLLGMENDIGLIPYDRQLLKHRRWVYSPLNSQASLARFMSIQQRESYILISGLIRDPEHFDSHIRRFTASVMLDTLYGYTVTSEDDEYIELMESVTDTTVALAAPGSAPVDFIPILMHLPAWLPGVDFKRRALRARKEIKAATNKMYAEASRIAASGEAGPSIIPSLIKQYKEKGVLDTEDPELMMFGAAVYMAGSDTTKCVLVSFILAMVLNPDVYAKAQTEMDHVVGSDRLPTVMDRESLPYLESILKEVLRWSVPVPLGLPHATNEDDVYGGFFIPKGTTVMVNLWFMLHDPDIWPEPESFRPERFEGLTDEEMERTDPRQLVFGHGRRICPGARFVDVSIWLVMANIIATLEIAKARDASGKTVTPPATFTDGTVRHPHKFTCSIKPRSELAIEHITSAMATLSA